MNELMNEGKNNLVSGDTACSTGTSVFLPRVRVSEHKQRAASNYPGLGYTDFYESLWVVLGRKDYLSQLPLCMPVGQGSPLVLLPNAWYPGT